MKKTLLMLIVLLAGFTVQAQEQSAETTAPAIDKSLQGLEIGGMIRVRPEIKQNYTFFETRGQGLNDNFVGQKSQIFVKKTLADGSSVKVTIQDSRVWGGEANANNGLSTANETESTDIREAYFNLHNPGGIPLDLQIGRQTLSYGNQRLVGPLEWTNVGRSWDAARLKMDTETNSFHVWSSVSSEGDDDLKNESDNTDEVFFNGIYESYNKKGFPSIDLYYLSDLNVTSNAARKLHTFGTRLAKAPERAKEGADYGVELAMQTGKANESVDANGKKIDVTFGGMAVILEAGYTFNAGLPMRLGGEFSVGTGDKSSTNDSNETFQNMYPTNHLFYGQADFISLQNAVIGGLFYQMFFNDETDLKLGYIYTQKDTSGDIWYDVAGSSTKNELITGSSKKQLFHEIDATLALNLRKTFSFEYGLSYVMRGEALVDKDKKTDAVFTYISTTMKF